jgi:hypothetical protein
MKRANERIRRTLRTQFVFLLWRERAEQLPLRRGLDNERIVFVSANEQRELVEFERAGEGRPGRESEENRAEYL